MSRVFPTTLRSTKSPTLNSLFITSLSYRLASFCWYAANRMVADSRYSSNKSSCFTINSPFSGRVNPETRALHKLASAGMTASAPYFRENGVSSMDLLGVVLYAQRMLGNSLAYLPLAPSSLFFKLFTITLLVVLAWPLLCGYAEVEYLFMISRSLHNLWKALLSILTHY